MNARATCILIGFFMVLTVVSFLYIPRVEWILAIILSATIYGSVSPLIAARRLYFLASEVSHIALFAVTISVALSRETPLNSEILWAIMVGLAIVYVVGYAIHKGFDPDMATSIVVSATASSSVVSMFAVLTRYRVEYSLWSIILGDPLLTTWRDIQILAAIGLVLLITALAIYRVTIYIGIDRDTVMLSVKNTHIYEFLFFTVLGVACIALMRIIGYIVEHVLLLLPALTAINSVEGSNRVLALSIYMSIVSGLLGLVLSYWLNIAPASGIGFTALTMYMLSIALKRVKK
ncbi:MAG: metal ABC transporter permease [Ignisphaera sp.]|uniref:Metal ABC transporter permease n=1 Tax=Ignisphaera aggregans TaxID=334771 RepID=A0A7J3MXQ1_9CREN